MRTIHVDSITEAVEKLCMDSNYYLNDDIINGLEKGLEKEESDNGKEILSKIIENAQIAREKAVAICQDTGMAVVFMDIGQDVHITGGNLTDAINEGVRRGYEKGYLRKSVVNDPIERINTKDNTPAVIHYNIVDGDKIKITVAPKGFGSENMSALKMLTPSQGIEGVKNFIIETVEKAGPNPCPPIVVGVGIGGTMEKAAFLAKKALLRPIDKRNDIPYLKELEEEMLERINRLGIGPSGLGGRITALGVNIEVFPTHIAGLPVAVNINCHATRHAEIII
ncbi:MAG TPA: fumarate hydratase [Hungateiclostridium thermocellum]|jgi:fumarate hydratase subunit alpha|uniref:Hydro-lyase, Fe-S type, tartrate/fumarate subfamily, alpha subunit n=2 Tax=Acetivibrio thermocellus TaxID=1515 RepID=A3DK06_ACET2|nr:fumarate hydratase [Acetivibrio thermocellus]CDG37569.1 putative fumarate hydratase subunit alpha [Acetivibrio thermocellus BC1]ABN54285.1 hydro-lyase, Fe-S type, tartrate/fumarate subfamily, alpha subunit [Acetivibrio thermocellus ATCC 27405]ADU73720.1 hydro-lyase, Fe-S type, tartrate/fumarate subfamily, alpha subunit [Acetivibrio thermocellus DSM 1313]ALX07650.1 hydro-lyase, Fe-S type, tartrate/fumarate subfamily, alpha subunit [Acetivibrio thermocellus AD2]ANV75392.1 hydro-lyase, Fe-S ty